LAVALCSGCSKTEIQPTGSVTFTHASTHLFSQLTPTEVDIVIWMSRGFTDPDEVAGTLFRSPNTIRTHLTNIFAKLDVPSRTAAAAYARDHDLI